MSLILAIEPDRRQASKIAALAKSPLHAELVVADSTAKAFAALPDRVPDLILTSLLLSPKDEAALADRLRELDAAGTHVQTLVIPVLGTSGRRSHKDGGGLLKRLRGGKGKDAAPDGCDPVVFANQIAEYLERARAERCAVAAALEDEMVGDHDPVYATRQGALALPSAAARREEPTRPAAVPSAPMPEENWEEIGLEVSARALADEEPEASAVALTTESIDLEAFVEELNGTSNESGVVRSMNARADQAEAAARETAEREEAAAARETAQREAAAREAVAKEAAARDAAARELAAREAAARKAAEAAAREAAAKETAAREAAARDAAARELAAREAAARKAAEAAAREAAAKQAAAREAAKREAEAREAAAREVAAKEAATRKAAEAAAKEAAAKEAAKREAAVKEAAAKEAAAREEAARREAEAREAAAREAARREAEAREAAAREAAKREADALEAAAREAAKREADAREAAAREAAKREAAAREAAAREAARREAAAKEAAAREAAAKEAAARKAAEREAAARKAAERDAAAREAAAKRAAAKEAIVREIAARAAAASVDPSAAELDPVLAEFLHDTALPAPSGGSTTARPAAGSDAPQQPEWMNLLTAIKRDIAQLRSDRAKSIAAADPPMASNNEDDRSGQNGSNGTKPRAAAARKRKKVTVPVQDEWGFFDPQQCGFAALLAKLDEITDQEADAPAQKPPTRNR